MSATGSRRLYEAILELNSVFSKGASNKILSDCTLGDDLAKIIINFTGLVNDCRDEILRSEFRDDKHYDILIDRLRKIQHSILEKIASRSSGSQGALVNEVVVERALSIAEQIDNAIASDDQVPQRQDMMRETEDLIASVKSWEIGDYARNSLLIQLNHVSRIIAASDMYSDNELRLRVKAIIADFAAEFVEMDKEHQDMLEKLVRWGRCGFFAGTTFLGLTSDISSVAGLLSAPPKLLTKG